MNDENYQPCVEILSSKIPGRDVEGASHPILAQYNTQKRLFSWMPKLAGGYRGARAFGVENVLSVLLVLHFTARETAHCGCPAADLTGLLGHDSIAIMAKVRYRYNIMLRPEPEGGYTALVPALPGCVTYGRTLEEAREMAKDAISGYIASLRKHKDPIPTDDNTLLASLDLEYAEAPHR